MWVRVSQNREASLSEAIMDSQSVETANFLAEILIRVTTPIKFVQINIDVTIVYEMAQLFSANMSSAADNKRAIRVCEVDLSSSNLPYSPLAIALLQHCY